MDPVVQCGGRGTGYAGNEDKECRVWEANKWIRLMGRMFKGNV